MSMELTSNDLQAPYPQTWRDNDDTRRIELFRACMDEQGRTMFDLRVLNYKWRTIARLTGYADAHSARVVFRRKMDRALERFRGLL